MLEPQFLSGNHMKCGDFFFENDGKFENRATVVRRVTKRAVRRNREKCVKIFCFKDAPKLATIVVSSYSSRTNCLQRQYLNLCS